MRINILFFLLLFPAFVAGQKLAIDSERSELVIAGTSSLHDWEIVAESIRGEANISRSGENLNIESLSFEVEVRGLKSGKEAMDKNTVKALQGKIHPWIYFTLEDGKYEYTSIAAQGTLKVADNKKKVALNATAQFLPDSAVRFTGMHKINMTDVGVEPPTALLGTLKTGDSITISFNVVYSSH